MISQEQAHQVMGVTAYDETGQKIGKVGQIFVDDETGEPEFATVSTGMLGKKESFVPIRSGAPDLPASFGVRGSLSPQAPSENAASMTATAVATRRELLRLMGRKREREDAALAGAR